VLVITGMQRLLVRIPLVTFLLPFLFWISGGCMLTTVNFCKTLCRWVAGLLQKDLLYLVAMVSARLVGASRNVGYQLFEGWTDIGGVCCIGSSQKSQ
jgi:hypothetical protein